MILRDMGNSENELICSDSLNFWVMLKYILNVRRDIKRQSNAFSETCGSLYAFKNFKAL